MEPAPDLIDEPAKQPTLVALLGQLAEDTRDFARAEIAFVKAQTGERVGYAVPGVVAVLAAMTMAMALIVAIIVAAMMALAAIWGTALAILAVTVAILISSALAGWWGARRIRQAVKAREVR
jgi:flagellar biosynthesis protein FliQ